MAEEIPVQQIAFISEWQFSTAMTPPTTTGQVRFNNNNQKNVTLIWIDKVTVNGNNASVYLGSLKNGSDIRLNDKADPAKWQSYTLTAAPLDKGTYIECPAIWKAGGLTLLAARLIVDLPLVEVSVAVTGFRLDTDVGHVSVSGQLLTREFAFPFEGRNYTSPGLTIRQYYASQAIVGFISAPNATAANLMGGRLAEYCFKLADSMLEYEAREALGYMPPLVGTPPNSPLFAGQKAEVKKFVGRGRWRA